MSTLAELDKITKVYQLGIRKKATAVDGVSFSITEGSVLGIVGPNGSGKSTSIKILLGLVHPTSGTAKLFGQLPSNRKIFGRLGYLPENAALTDTLKSKEILSYHARVHQLAPALRKRRIDEMLHLVGLENDTRKTIRQYSKGMVQRLALACALIHDPELLILDEPMSGLDPIGRRFVIDLLAGQHRAGKTICFSSHVLYDVEELCSDLVVIYKSKLVFAGPKADFLSHGANFRLIFRCAGGAPRWLEGAVGLGPEVWSIRGQSEYLLGLIERLRADGGEIIEFAQERTSLESSFFKLVNT